MPPAMKPPRVLVWLGMLLLCAGGIWLWATIGAGEAPQLADSGAPRQEEAAPLAGSTGATVQDASRVEIAAEEAAVVSGSTDPYDTQPSATSVVVVGRCIDLDAKAPAPGVAMRLRGRPASEIKLARYEQELRWKDPEPVRTDAQGRFAFVIEPEPPLMFDLAPDDPHWVGQQKHWSELTPEQRIDLGDVPLRRLHAQQVRVVDLDGEPVPDITLQVRFWDPRMMAAWRPLRATSDADGLAAFDPGLPHGPLNCEIAGGLAWRSYVPLRIEASGAIPTVVVERLPAALAGVVVDARGMPVAELDLHATAKSARGPYNRITARTAADGSFTFPAMHPAPDGWLLRANRPWLDTTLDTRAFASGTRDLRLEVTEYGAIEVEVLAADTGAPIERFAVGWHRLQGQGHRLRSDPPALHPGGRARLDGFAPGTWQIQVLPGDPALAVSTPADVVVQPAQTASLRVLLQTAPAVRVHVVHEGAPIAGAEVELLRVPDAAKWNPHSDVAELMPALGWHQQQHVIRVGAAVSDADGRATIRSVTHEAVHARARVDGFLPVVQPVPAGAQEVTLELVRGASLQVRLVPDGIAAELARVSWAGWVRDSKARLQLYEFSNDPQPQRGLLASFDGGSTRLSGLAPGPARIGLAVPGLYRVEKTRGIDHIAFQERVILTTDQEQVLEFDLSQVRPADVELTLMTEHGPLRGAFVYLYHQTEGSMQEDQLIPMGQITATTDDQGRLPPQVILPGSYTVIAHEDSSGGLGAETRTTETLLTVTPGQQLTTTLLVRPGQMACTLRGADGAVLRHCRIQIDAGSKYGATTDAHGVMRIAKPRSGTIQLELRRADNPLRTLPWLPEGTDTAGAETTWEALTGAPAPSVTLRPKQ